MAEQPSNAKKRKHVSTDQIKEILKDQGSKCKNCGAEFSKTPFEIHHINHDASDSRIENLEALCRNCHHEIGLKRELASNEAEIKRLEEFTQYFDGTKVIPILNEQISKLNHHIENQQKQLSQLTAKTSESVAISEEVIPVIKPKSKTFTIDAILKESSTDREKLFPLLDVLSGLRAENRTFHLTHASGLQKIEDLTTELKIATNRSERVTYTSLGITISALIITFVSVLISYSI